MLPLIESVQTDTIECTCHEDDYRSIDIPA